MNTNNNKFNYKLRKEASLESIPVETGNYIITLDTKRVYADIKGERVLINSSIEDIEDRYALKSETYTKTEIDSKMSVVFKYKGTVATYDDLPKSGNQVGDVYNVDDTGANYAWDGSKWDKLSEAYDFSVFAQKTEMEEAFDTLNSIIQDAL